MTASVQAHTVPKIQGMYSQEKELRVLNPNSYIHVSVSNLHIPRIGPHSWLQQNRQTDPGNTVYISLTDICTVIRLV